MPGAISGNVELQAKVRKRVIMSVALSILPGLGHIYNRIIAKGIFYFIVFCVSERFLYLITFENGTETPYFLTAFGVAAMAAVFGLIAFDAGKAAEKHIRKKYLEE